MYSEPTYRSARLVRNASTVSHAISGEGAARRVRLRGVVGASSEARQRVGYVSCYVYDYSSTFTNLAACRGWSAPARRACNRESRHRI